MTHGERVKAIRKELNLNMEKFGAKLGVSKQSISAIELDNRNLTEQLTLSICRTYNVSYDWLTREEGEMFVESSDEYLDQVCREHQLDEFDKKILKAYIELPEDVRRFAKEYLKKIVEKEKED